MNASDVFSVRAYLALFSIVALTTLTLVFASVAGAAWPTGASLVSGSMTAASPYQSSSNALGQIVSDDGRYAVFFSASSALSPSAPNGGLFRKNLQNDAAPLDVVVAVPAPVAGIQCGVTGTSYFATSANGRYIAFASGENGLTASDSNNRRDVFVRDMSVAVGPGAYELASAPDGSTAGATYALADGGGSGLTIPPEQNCLYGADLPGPHAITNDGKKVLFTNSAFTNIAHVSAGNSTAPGQLFVRSVSPAAPATELITKIAYNFSYSIPGVTDPVQAIGDPLPDQEYFDTDPNTSARTAPLAAISGDGSAVTWAGPFARNQAAYHRGENVVNSGLGSYDKVNYLYRRIADGASATTRRVVSWSDVDDFNCDPNLFSYDFVQDPVNSSETACAGPVSDEGLTLSDARVPQITDNGRRVFFLLDERARFLIGPTSGYPNDMVTADMTPGVSRKAGFRYLTQATISAGAYPDAIQSFAVSGDGKQVAFITTRRDFSSTGLIQTGAVPATNNLAAVFEIDGSGAGGFTGAPIEWIARPTGGTDVIADLGASLSFNRNGNTLVFSSADQTFYAGHNAFQQVLCVKKGGTCGAAVAAPAPTVEISSPINSSTLSSPQGASYSAADATSVTCQWDSETVLNPCPSSPLPLKTLSVGSHTFSVTANGTGSATVTSTFTVGALPTATISAPAAGSTNLISPLTPAYTTTGATSVICWWDSGTWLNPCPSTPPAKALASGIHTFNVKVTNAAGSATTTNSFTVLNPPTVKITKPFASTQWTSPIVATFTSTDATTKTCQWDAQAVISNCTSPLASKTLTDGTHTLKVTVTNANGSATQTNTFTIGPVIPAVVTINNPANGSTVDATVVGQFTLTGGGATSVTCQWDLGNIINNCVSPMTAKALTNGTHKLTVKATNANAVVTTAVNNFTVGAVVTPPTVTIDGPSDGGTVASPVNASFTLGGDPPTSTSCQWDSEPAISPCASPLVGKVLTPGTHTFSASATNTGGTGTALSAFTVLAPLPVVSVASPANNTNTTASSINVSYTVNGGTTIPGGTTCTVGGVASITPTTNSVALVVGENVIPVSCANTTGTGTQNVTVNRGTAPNVTISAPANNSGTTATTAAVSWSSTGTAPIGCTIGGSTATSPNTVNLSAGANTITVVCSNDFGTDSDSIVVNQGALPVVTIGSPTEAQTIGSPVTASFALSGGAATSVSCQWDSESVISPCTSPQGPKTLANGAHTFKVSALNLIGSVTETRNFTVAPVPSVSIQSPASSSSIASPVSGQFTVSGETSKTCQWDAEAVISACTSPQSGKVLAPGSHTFKVSATNGAGTVTVASTFTVLPPLPTVTIGTPSNGGTVESPASGTFVLGGGPAATVTCQWDAEAVISPCASPQSGKVLGAGAHSFKVTVTNAAGADTKTTNFSVSEPVIQPPPAGTPTPTPPAPSLNALKSVVKAAVATIPLEVVGAGSVSATGTAKLPKGKKLKLLAAGSGSAVASASGTVQLNFKLNGPAKKYLAKKGKLSVSVKITFTPAGGTPITRTVSVSFKAKKK
jgi:hypothetical protein